MPNLRSIMEGEVRNQREALNLFENAPKVDSPDECRDLDFEEKDNWEIRGNKGRGYYCRFIAAVNYERFGFLEEATFSYTKASTLADNMGFMMAAIRCRIRACKIFKKLIDESNSEDEKKKHSRQLGYTANRIVDLVERAKISELRG